MEWTEMKRVEKLGLQSRVRWRNTLHYNEGERRSRKSGVYFALP